MVYVKADYSKSQKVDTAKRIFYTIFSIFIYYWCHRNGIIFYFW